MNRVTTRVKVQLPGEEPRYFKGKNAITGAGVTRCRDALVGVAGSAIGALTIHNGPSGNDPAIGTTAEPTAATAASRGVRYVLMDHELGADLDVADTLSATSGDGGALFTVARTSLVDQFDRALPAMLGSGASITIEWALGCVLASSSDEVPGSAGSANLADSLADLANVIAGHVAGGANGSFQEWQTQDSDDEDQITNPERAVMVGANVPVAFAADGAAGVSCTVTLPAIPSSDHVAERGRWYVLLLQDAIIAVDNSRVENTDSSAEIPNRNWGFDCSSG